MLLQQVSLLGKASVYMTITHIDIFADLLGHLRALDQLWKSKGENLFLVLSIQLR